MVADRVGERVRRAYQTQVRAVGVHGSLAHGDDRDGSDVDLVVVTYRPAEGPESFARRIDGVIVHCAVIDADTHLERARTLSMSWPVTADRYVTTKPLFDPEGWFDAARDAHLARLVATTGREFAALARQAWCRAASIHAEAARPDGGPGSGEVSVSLAEARVSVAIVKGLLTRTYFRNGEDAVRRTGTALMGVADLGVILAGQADDLARRGCPVDAVATELFA
jgi:hypothetical protein